MSFAARLSHCECCPRHCGVDRLAGEAGFCRVPPGILISHAGLHFGEEPPLSGSRGSGTIFFAGCNLRCVFCQNYQISQEFEDNPTWLLTIDELASIMLQLQDEGAHNVNFVSPSHMVLQMADAIVLARARGLKIPVVYNSNGYDEVETLRLIRGLVDIYLPDFKYLHNALAGRLSAAGDYADIVPGVLREMLHQVGNLQLDEAGIATRGLLVRHLVLPGHLDNSRRCLKFLAELSPDIAVSIMSQYSPQYRACQYPGIDRTLTEEEYDDIMGYALDLGLDNAFIQELTSQDLLIPDFRQNRPFEAADDDGSEQADAGRIKRWQP
ncbi:radical SAM protein [Desulfoprunum benzoelyticum]|uniref:Putative pyruvate formate lyase activating enzyme n=1 Tax=Desulfoprunum benzoelyticum TaxID=1506996 RepID=A0A840V0G8_9BACT|nr:radical SAM protein [Desulfoprunum benzoelyticum]MBB5347209.1 putative pyruvate formate lyase activating enzyme [Desulfoprunum benzoelyticum]MBM9530465.1 radical SAM protein [Desulfoprunum benzoelyticum]